MTTEDIQRAFEFWIKSQMGNDKWKSISLPPDTKKAWDQVAKADSELEDEFRPRALACGSKRRMERRS